MTTPDLVLHDPHSSTVVPEAVRGQFVLGDAELELELLLMTDRYVDELFTLPAAAAVSVRHGVSRLVCDPERFERDEDEEMAGIGMGVLYTRTHTGDPEKSLRRELSDEERRTLLDAYYRPHHARLEQATSNAVRVHGHCLIVDAHSFPQRPLPYEKSIRPEDLRWTHRPAICLGTDGFHTPLWLQAAAFDAFEARFESVAFISPFDGTIVPMRFYRRDARVCSIMIEVRRDQYMDEQAGQKLPGFDEVAARIQAAVREMAAAAALLRDLT